MPDTFAIPTRELLNDTAICAVNDARERAPRMWEARETFLELAGAAFDRAADPTGEFALQRPEFLG